jgi:hypothetical protein
MNLKPHTTLATQAAALVACLLVLPAASARNNYKVLHEFGGVQDGSLPSGPLLIDGKGRLYGSTYNGGTGQCSDYGCGMTFELQPQADGGWKEVALHEFTNGKDGAIPVSNMVSNGTGLLYGTVAGDIPG